MTRYEFFAKGSHPLSATRLLSGAEGAADAAVVDRPLSFGLVSGDGGSAFMQSTDCVPPLVNFELTVWQTLQITDAPKAGQTVRWGLFRRTADGAPPETGILFELVDGELFIRVASPDDAPQVTLQSRWNRDPMDGTRTADHFFGVTDRNTYIMKLDSEGTLTLYVRPELWDGVTVPVHQCTVPPALIATYFKLPISMTVAGDRAGADLLEWSAALTGTGARQSRITPMWARDRPVAQRSFAPLFGVRARGTCVAHIHLDELDVDAPDDLELEMRVGVGDNGLRGGEFAAVDAAESLLCANVTAAGVNDGTGTLVWAGLVEAGVRTLRVDAQIANPYTLVVMARLADGGKGKGKDKSKDRVTCAARFREEW